MRILIISYYYPPIQSVASERLYCFAKYLSEFGNEIEVLTSFTNQEFTNDLPNVKVVRIKSKIISTIESKFSILKTDQKANSSKNNSPSIFIRLLRRVNCFRINRGLGYLGRMPDVTDFWYWNAKGWLKEQEPWDCIISSYAPYSTLLLGLYAKKNNKCNIWVTDFRDLWTKHHLFSGLFPFTYIEKYLEKKVISKADLITTVSPELAQELHKLSPPREPSVIYNGYRPIKELTPPTIKIPGSARFKIVHTGSIYSKYQNIEPFIKAIKLLITENENSQGSLSVTFVGANKELVDELAAKHDISDAINHPGLVSMEQSRKLQQQADLLLYFDYHDLAYDGVLPCKLYEYASTGNKVLFLQNRKTSSAKEFLKNCGTGLFINNEELEIRKHLSELSKYPNKPNVGNHQANWSYISKFTRENQVKVLNEKLESL